MSNLLIGGSARCGKSTLAAEIRQTTGMQALSGDALRTSLRKASILGTFPVLHSPRPEKIQDDEEFIRRHTELATQEVEAKHEQARFVWPFIEKYVEAIEHESGEPVVVDSIDVWPDIIATSGLSHRAAFLVNTSQTQADRIISTRGTDPYDWIHENNYSDDRIRAWSQFNAERSVTIRELADMNGYYCVDLAEISFDEAQASAREYLLAT